MRIPQLSQAELMLSVRMLFYRLGWLGLAGILLIVAWGVAEFGWMPRQQQQIEANETRIRALQRQIVSLNVEGVRNLDPQARLEAFTNAFPSRGQLPDELAKLNQTLATAGVRVDSAEYQPDTAKDGSFPSITVSMVVKIAYPRLRSVLDAVREAMPTVAIDDIQLKRETIGSPEAEARVRFKLFMRQRA